MFALTYGCFLMGGESCLLYLKADCARSNIGSRGSSFLSLFGSMVIGG